MKLSIFVLMIDKVGPKQGDVTYIEFWKDNSVLNNIGVSTTALYNILTKVGVTREEILVALMSCSVST